MVNFKNKSNWPIILRLWWRMRWGRRRRQCQSDHDSDILRRWWRRGRRRRRRMWLRLRTPEKVNAVAESATSKTRWERQQTGEEGKSDTITTAATCWKRKDGYGNPQQMCVLLMVIMISEGCKSDRMLILVVSWSELANSLLVSFSFECLYIVIIIVHS